MGACLDTASRRGQVPNLVRSRLAKRMSVRVAFVAGLAALVTLTSVLRGQEEGPFAHPLPEPALADADPVELRPTNHPDLPVVVAEYWLVSDPSALGAAEAPAAAAAQGRVWGGGRP